MDRTPHKGETDGAALSSIIAFRHLRASDFLLRAAAIQ
jgi:hypothetical protein